ncbi:MAG: cyclic pyranopterin phosphate synthase [Verrucomicrobiales bacterium]|jgi:cyclic pyranopterin phosphate synthase
MPDEEQEWLGREDVLSYEEIMRVIRVGVSLGISKIRVTGGEPLTRPGVIGFIGQIATLEQVKNIGLSTNGTLLARHLGKDTESAAAGLIAAGVTALNLSLDTLDREFYAKTTGRDFLPQFKDGLQAARDVGFQRIRINAVLMRGRNEHELWDMIEFARENECILRFIEMMPVSTREVLTEDNFLSAGEARKIIEFRYGELEPMPEFRTNGPAVYYRIPNSDQRIGFINAMSNLHFCDSCDKLRLTADGKLRPCLGSHLEFDLRGPLRDPATTDEDLCQIFRDVVDRKPQDHDFRENYEPQRRMIAIGG